MNKWIYLIGFCLLFGLISCEQDLDTWSGANVAYFDQTVDSTVVSFVYIDSKYQYDTVYIQARVMGEVTDHKSRFIGIKVAETNAIAGEDYVALENSYEVEPGRTFCYIPIYLIRNESLKKEIKEITLELVENHDFKLYYPEDALVSGSDIKYTKITHRIVFHEMMLEPPTTWREYQLGTFTSKKFQTICDVMRISRTQFITPSYMTIGRLNFVASYMKDYLQRMKDAGTPVLEEDGTEMKMGDNM